MSMYYIVGNSGQVEGPYEADWIRHNVRGQTLVSYGQQWVALKAHPDLGNVTHDNVRSPGLVGRLLAWWTNASAVTLLVAAVIFSTVTITINALLIHDGRDTLAELVKSFYMSLTWMLLFAALLSLAYIIGKLLGGRATFRDVFHGFARTILVLYVALPLSLFTYTMWFKWLWENYTILALLFLMVQVVFVPFVCIWFTYKGMRTFVTSMAFEAVWRAWATIGLATLTCTMVLLLAGGWFEWFRAFLSAMFSTS